MERRHKIFLKILALVSAHLYIIGLSIGCGPEGSTAKGPYLLVADSGNDYYDDKQVDFFVDDDVDSGTLTGWIQAAGCEVTVTICDDICDDEDCEEAFSGYVDGEAEIEVESEDNEPFQHFINDFEPCYTDGEEFVTQFFSCEYYGCYYSRHSFDVVLESDGCYAAMQFVVEVKYHDYYVSWRFCDAVPP